MKHINKIPEKAIVWIMLMAGIFLTTIFSVSVSAQSSQQSGTACANGTQYCENSNVYTTNETTTNNTNTNANTNINTNTDTSTPRARDTHT